MRSRRAALGVAALLILGLGACAGTLPGRHAGAEAVARYTLDGRFSLRQGERTFAGRLSWTHAPDSDRVLVADPFGSGIAELDRRPGLARLTLADGRVSEDVDAEALMRGVTGLPLPVAGVGEWLTGRLAEGPDNRFRRVERDAFGRAVTLERDGWQVRFDYAEDLAEALPSRIQARRADELELRLSVDNWTIDR